MLPRVACVADPIAKDTRREVIYEADETDNGPIHPSVINEAL